MKEHNKKAKYVDISILLWFYLPPPPPPPLSQAIRVEKKGLVNEARQDNERNNQTRTEVNNSTSADNTPIATEENTDTLNHPEPILEPTIQPIILEEPEVTQEPEKEVTDEELEQIGKYIKTDMV